jgi:hypothetical protein
MSAVYVDPRTKGPAPRDRVRAILNTILEAEPAGTESQVCGMPKKKKKKS